ncbi:MAG: hypothetical protein JWO38_3925 [Gemmataceae bacterium]|nr:hypothetical protein [Gemmataceae bacterium]
MRRLQARITSRKNSGLRFRPRLEALDERIVPAGYYVFWADTAGDHLATNPANWQGAGPTGLPSAGDNVYFGTYGSDDCQGFSGSYRTVILNSVYTGKVTLSGALNVGTFGLSGGEISQPVAGTDITVTRVSGMAPPEVPGFTWHGGILNGSTNAANLTVDNGTALISDGTLSTADTLKIVNNTTATFQNVGITFKAGTGLLVSASAVTIAAQNNNVTFTSGTSGTSDLMNWITAGGSITVTGPKNWSANGVPLKNDGGTFTVQGGATASFVGSVGTGAVAGSVLQTATAGGVMLIENGSTVQVDHGVYLAGGKLSTKPVGSGAQQDAKITGNLTVAGADVVIDDPAFLTQGAAHVYGVLNVNGDVTWTSGVYRPFVGIDVNGARFADLWKATTFTITLGAGGAILGPNPPWNPKPYDLTNVSWVVVKATGPNRPITLVNDPNNTRTLNFERPAQSNDWGNGIPVPSDVINLWHVTPQ